MSLRLDNARVVDPASDGPRVLDDVSIHVEDGRIREIGTARPEAEHVLDASDHLVIPGLVNAHTHAAMTLLRGHADDLSLERWLRERVWPLEAHLDRDAVEAGARLAICEMLATGTTAFADMYLFEDAVAEAADEAGIRCLAGASIVDFQTPQGDLEAQMEAAEALLDRWPGSGDRVRAAVAPHAAYTCSGETLERCAELAQAHGARLMTHCAETRHEVYTVEADTGRRPPAQLAEHGCLEASTLAAHCGWMTKAEARTLAQAGATAVHCPTANMKLATGGYMPLPELLDAGGRVALGTDGPASNNTLDLFEEIKRAALLHKHHRWDAGLLPAGQAFALATREGAQAIGFPEAGRVREGARADLALVDARQPHMAPMHDPVSQLVYAATGADVTTTIVAGEILYRDGEHTTLDAGRAMDEAAAAAGRLVDAAAVDDA